MAKTIAVFGTARTEPDSDLYRTCVAIGQALAQAGHITMSGGYEGVMEAVSRGAAEAGGSVYGITVEKLERAGASRLNQWVSREYRYPTLRERTDHLINRADAYILMPGGIGTMHDFVEVWQRMRLKDIPQRPLFVYGDFWKDIVNKMRSAGYIHEWDVELLVYVETPQEIIEALRAWYEEG